jgi:sugar phosphate isomerase/epimerase
MDDHGKVNRREALRQMGAVAALASFGTLRGETGGAAALARPGLQLYTVRSEMQRSVERTLERVAQIGYREVEFAGYFGRTPAQIDRALKAVGLSAPAAHVGRETLGARWQQTLEAAVAAGHRYLVVPSLPESDRASADTYKRLAAEFNKAGEAAKLKEVTFAYHNHSFEFTSLGSTYGHEVLLTECDPAVVKFELDLYWLARAGKDPVAYVTQYPERFALVHVKDMARDGSMTEVGSGTLDFQRVFDAGRAGIRHFFVEHDQPRDPYESITTSLAAMRRYTV